MLLCVTLFFLAACFYTKTVSYIHPISNMRKAASALYVSKHLSSQLKRSGEEMRSEFREIDPKKLEMLSRLGLDKDEAAAKAPKTGAEMRKARKIEVKKEKMKEEQRVKARAMKMGTATPTSKQKTTNEKAIRFVLGSGTEALTAQNLLDLVKSTSPYLFPESSVRLVLDETDFDLPLEDDEDDNDSERESSAHHHTSSPTHSSSTSSSTIPQELSKADKDSSPPGVYDTENTGAAYSTLAKLSEGPMGWLSVLKNGQIIPSTATPTEAQRVDYFTLCTASHFATVATYVPTDVDSKIRGHCWYDPSRDVLLAQWSVLKNALKWDVEQVSRKTLRVKDADEGFAVSGHMGEWLGCLGGAWGAFLRLGEAELAAEAESIIRHELEREAAAFRKVRLSRSGIATDTLLLKLAAVLTHNVGDVDQGLSYWTDLDADGKSPKFEDHRVKYARLAHERSERFGGEYAIAKALYKELLSAEGHRNYPLREPKCLRSTSDLMLPLGPWYENWGRLVGTHPALSQEEKIQVVRQLLRGCDSQSKAWCVPNQVGYYRALNGINSVMNLDLIAKELDKDCRAVLKGHDVRLHLGISEDAFAARLGSQARDILDSL